MKNILKIFCLAVPTVLLLAGCPGGGGGSGRVQESGGASAVVYTANNGSNNLSGFTIQGWRPVDPNDTSNFFDRWG
jgi:hypothetical protein